MRLIKVLAIAILLAGTLSSCLSINPPMGPGPLALRADGDSVVVATCRAIRLETLTGQFRSEATDREWVRFWEAAGDLELSAGDTFDPETAGLVFTMQEAPPLTPGTEVTILAKGSSAAAAILGSFNIPPSGLDDSKWLHADGTETEAACP